MREERECEVRNMEDRRRVAEDEMEAPSLGELSRFLRKLFAQLAPIPANLPNLGIL